jgi:8-oxo-dGTP diphosphatase
MADRASAIILSKRHLLLIHRIREAQDYYVFPGGHIETGESAEQACIREVLEETGLHIAWMRYAFDHAAPARLMHYFFVQTHPGTLTLGGPEAKKQSQDNRYLLEWIPMAHVGMINLQPAPVRLALEQIHAEHGPLREARDLALHRERLCEILALP